MALAVGCSSPAPRRNPPGALPSRTELAVETIPWVPMASPIFTLKGEFGHLLFHLNFFNRSDRPLKLRKLEMISLRSGERLTSVTLSQRSLAQRLRPVPWIVMRDRQTIAAAHRWRGELRRTKGDTVIPARGGVSLTHQLILARLSQMPDKVRCVVTHTLGSTVHRFTVQVFQQKTRLRLPVHGPWWVMAGHRFDEYHGQALMHSQNFAYDLGRLGSNLGTFQGDRRANESYYCHDQPILAAADGQVVEVHDQIPENVPVGFRPSWEQILRRPRDMAGNFVVLRHCKGEYSAYMHLRPGVPVRQGDQVSAGQVVGRCGNSGNSSEAHLHFQLQDGPDPLKAVGLPARFSDVTIHLARQKLYVPPHKATPLPTWLLVQPGKAPGAVDISR